MKSQDEIVDEVRRVREAYAARFGYDLKRMFKDLQRKEQSYPGPRAKLKPVKPISKPEE